MAKKKDTKKVVQSEIAESAHKIWLAGLGALASAEEGGSKLFKSLVEKGETFEARGKKQFGKVKDKVRSATGKAESTIDAIGDTFDEKVSVTLKKLGVPTRSEIARLTKRVEELNKKVDQLKPRAKKTAAKKTTTRARKSA